MEQLEAAIKFFKDNWISIISLIISISALIITWKKNIIDRHQTNDKDLLEQLKTSMKVAYDSISRDDGNDHFPISDRLKWFTSARHIMRYRELRSGLKTNLYKTICDEQEEFWRNNFYALLEKIDSSSFFEYIDQDEMVEENIEPRSAAIVLSFSTWKEGLEDPIDSLDFEEMVMKYNFFTPTYRHFKHYVERRFPEQAKRIRDLITSQST